MIEGMWTAEEYPYRGVALQPHMLEEIAERAVSPGGILERSWLINEAPQIHTTLGGRPTDVDPVSQAKKARNHLVETGWEKAGIGYIRRPGNTTNQYTESIIEQEDVTDSEIDTTEWHGTDKEFIYGYTFPCYLKLASLNQATSIPIKIGMTSDTPHQRISTQCGTSNPENPVILFSIQVEDAKLFENTIHRVLKIRNRWMKDAPGSEWYNTSKEEIFQIIDFIQA